MPEVIEFEKCHSKRSMAQITITKSANRIRELITEKGSISTCKVCQFANSTKEANTKERDLTRRPQELDPESIESDGSWLDNLEYGISENLGEVLDYLAPKCNVERQSLEAHSVNENVAERFAVL